MGEGVEELGDLQQLGAEARLRRKLGTDEPQRLKCWARSLGRLGDGR